MTEDLLAALVASIEAVKASRRSIPKTPRPSAPERPGLVIEDAPGVHNGWQRKCVVCWCSVDAEHVPDSLECRELSDERLWKNRD